MIAESPTAPPSRALAHAHHRRRRDEGLLLRRMTPEAVTSAFVNGGSRAAGVTACSAANWIIRER